MIFLYIVMQFYLLGNYSWNKIVDVYDFIYVEEGEIICDLIIV